MSKSVNVDFVTRQIEVDTDGKEHFISAAMAAKDAEQSMLNAQNAATSVQKYKALWFDSVAAMKAEPSLTAGAYVCTAGYYSPNDGGGASYLIRDKLESDIDDGGSLHYLANELVAELIIENGTVNVKQFGAVGDAVSDDTAALQRIVDYSALHNSVVLLNCNLIVSNTIIVPSYVCIKGYIDIETMPKILFTGSNLVFDCVSICNSFRDFIVSNFENVYRSFDGFRFQGNSSKDIDSSLFNVSIRYCDKGITAQGRNLKLSFCNFTHTRIGAEVSIQGPSMQARGIQIEYCRFHGVGEELALNWFENSCAILLNTDSMSNVTIRNCICDQSGTFIKGYCSIGLIANNFVESFKQPCIEIVNSDLLYPPNMGSMNFVGNMFYGKSGEVAQDVSVDYPQNIILLKNFGRVAFRDNVVGRAKEELVSLENVKYCSFTNNSFISAGTVDTSRNYALKSANSSISFSNNDALNSMSIINSASDTSANIKGNTGFDDINANNLTLTAISSMVLLGTCKAGTELLSSDLSLPKNFIVQKPDSKTLFSCNRYGDYITNGISWSSDMTSFFALSWDKTDTGFIPRLKEYTISNIGAPVTYASTLQILVEANI